MATAQKKPARPPRKPAGASGSAGGGTRAQKPATGRRTAKTAGPTKPNPFDDIARQVIADQEAKDRAAGRGDLTPMAKSVDQARAKRSGTSRAATKPAKPRRPTKVQANGNGVTFRGRSTTKVEIVAARVKQLGLRVRSDADVDAIAARLRATPDAVSAWLATRNGKPTARTKAAAKPKPNDKPRSAGGRDRSDWLTGITLQHPWTGKTPDYLRNRVMVIRYQVKADGTVWATLTQLREADGSLVPDFKDYPLDYRPTQERDSRNRAVVLKGDLEGPALRDYLLKQGLATPRDIDIDTNTV